MNQTHGQWNTAKECFGNVTRIFSWEHFLTIISTLDLENVATTISDLSLHCLISFSQMFLHSILDKRQVYVIKQVCKTVSLLYNLVSYRIFHPQNLVQQEIVVLICVIFVGNLYIPNWFSPIPTLSMVTMIIVVQTLKDKIFPIGD